MYCRRFCAVIKIKARLTNMHPRHGIFVLHYFLLNILLLTFLSATQLIGIFSRFFMFTPYRIAFAPQRESYRMQLLFTQKTGDFGAISVTERSCAAPISKVEPPFIAPFCWDVQKRSPCQGAKRSGRIRKLRSVGMEGTWLGKGFLLGALFFFSLHSLFDGRFLHQSWLRAFVKQSEARVREARARRTREFTVIYTAGIHLPSENERRVNIFFSCVI